MILGAHDCITYKKPRFFFMKPFSKIAKCQDKSIQELLNLNIKCFDLRIRFRNKKPYHCHGLIEYKGNLEDILDSFKNYEGIYVRLGLENIYGNKDLDYFLEYGKNLFDIYPNIKFQICKKKPQWTILLDNFDKQFIEILEWPNTIWKLLKTPRGLTDSLVLKFIDNKDRDIIISGDFILELI